ncbi:MAG: TIGR01777 family oxidoreductase [Cyclobacteriaceae bacterium]
MAKNILITGASGLLGSRLTSLLLQKGYQVSHLSRSAKQGPVKTYEWDIEKGIIDPQALSNCDAIVHLAGAGIADKRWTASRKKEILESRTNSTNLLYQSLKKMDHHVKSFISASAIGYYGFGGDEVVFDEQGKQGSDFLAMVTGAWENEVDKVKSLDMHVAKIRIGIVLSAEGGALAEMIKPIKFGVGSPLGTGEQPMSWIHIDDVCGMFIHVLEQPSVGDLFNAVAGVESNKEFTKAVAKTIGKPLWLPNVPSFVLRLVLGEMADLVLKGSRVSSNKIQETGYKLKYPSLAEALQQLLIA